MPDESIYTGGQYAAEHPSWHAEDSAWKAEQIHRMMTRNRLDPQTICEIGCGAGEILRQLHERMGPTVRFLGREVSPQALDLCRKRESERIHFELDNGLERQEHFDVILLIDLIEHVPDYLGLLARIRNQSDHKVLHIPLDISVQTVWRASPFERLRRQVGHIHYFTKEIALDAIRSSGYEVVDWFYTSPSTQLPATSSLMRAARVPRQLLFALNKDFTVRVLGGYSLMVLAS